MSDIRSDFLATSRSAAGLLRDPAVAAAWDSPSALPEFTVGGLAGHLAYQILAVPDALSAPVPSEPVIPLLDHYGRVEWIDGGLDADINVRIRAGGARIAAEGPAALAARTAAVVEELGGSLGTAPARAVHLPIWDGWSLSLDDMLVTRMMELAVHSDDLAVSARVPTPGLTPGAVETVVGLLSRLAVRRHGPTAVLRALSRAERAPSSVTAF
ncbi:maleylpyruvate isomerase N-terminal domain-containing protein [Amycolatopsis minnesotensis]|uniref:Mycothiol-dependent maleylpyruvate isomerase metal-binding domain-containing protein n=1 Tax=Amycolatopsis minnesotensis TaxID=337894 RepID=A0ABN2RRY4_9PSEU